MGTNPSKPWLLGTSWSLSLRRKKPRTIPGGSRSNGCTRGSYIPWGQHRPDLASNPGLASYLVTLCRAYVDLAVVPGDQGYCDC